VDYRALAWPPGTTAIRLDHERFAYAGKFVVPSGVAVAVETGGGEEPQFPPPREGYARGVVAAARFDPDRTDPGTLVVRYVTTRRDRRGKGVGARLLAFVAAGAGDPPDEAVGDGADEGSRPFDRVRIAVNNPYAHEAAAKAGFGFAGRETGLAELVCERPAGGPPGRVASGAYREALARFAARNLGADERAFVAARRDREPPATVAPGGTDGTDGG